ncbi:nitric oxide reductase transcriptional regulator NorR [Parasalinivibrio latis]|uniref:nitric oxide reductase transcriptional regulator NorR n=1 Tax=Parasalinivibrio latis TaxID=2952610 RepID=UPI0030E03761
MKLSLARALLQISLDLNINLPTGHHYQRLISAIVKVLPCDACALFILDAKGTLAPVAVEGLTAETLGMRFSPESHPRLRAIIESRKPVRFDSDSTMPDPFDGLLAKDTERTLDVHSCMGSSLYIEDHLIGLITFDAEGPDVFSKIEDITVETFAALAAATIRNVSMMEALENANRHQKEVTKVLIEDARKKGGELVGISPQIERLKGNIALVANSDYAVLIQGETGTGKELVAHAIHAGSRRADKPMVYVNCAALPESIAESELFGHIKGAFTGATSNRAGKFELADGGTIFLDEIGELPLLLQAKLLRVIQQGEVQRVGADQNLHIDVRIVAATNRDLMQEVENGQFRSDLYHRLNVFPIRVPPLRSREGDIPVLAGYFLDKIRHQFNTSRLHIHPSALTRLENFSWPGNVRELEHTLMRAGLRTIQQGDSVISIATLGAEFDEDLNDKNAVVLPDHPISMRDAVEDYQRELIKNALKQNNGVWSRAARALGMDRGNLHKLGVKLGLKE